MSEDPLDRPPKEDHGADRWNYVELVGAPPDVVPPDELVDSMLAGGACQDCNVNLFFYWRPEVQREKTGLASLWAAEIAHDDQCPTFLRLEREGKLGGTDA